MYLFARTSYGIHMTTRQLLESSDINILIPLLVIAGSIKAQLFQFHYTGLNPWTRVNKICILLCIVSQLYAH
jgi:hypothetical protein